MRAMTQGSIDDCNKEGYRVVQTGSMTFKTKSIVGQWYGRLIKIKEDPYAILTR